MARVIKRKTFKIALLVLAALLLLSVYIYVETYSIEVKHYTIPIEGLPEKFEGFTILHITDLHSKRFGEKQENLLGIISKQQFDIIALTGDLIDKGRAEPEPTAELLEGLNHSEIYFVPGNHEHKTDYENFKEIFHSHEVTILENRAVKYGTDDSHLWLLGVDDPYLGLARLDKALEGVTSGAPLILLAHAPGIYAEAVKKDIDLLLVGHTHGGQIRVPFFGAVYVSGQGFPPKFDYGIFPSNSTHMVINAGLGESVIPFRFNMRPEVVLITLEPL